MLNHFGLVVWCSEDLLYLRKLVDLAATLWWTQTVRLLWTPHYGFGGVQSKLVQRFLVHLVLHLQILLENQLELWRRTFHHCLVRSFHISQWFPLQIGMRLCWIRPVHMQKNFSLWIQDITSLLCLQSGLILPINQSLYSCQVLTSQKSSYTKYARILLYFPILVLFTVVKWGILVMILPRNPDLMGSWNDLIALFAEESGTFDCLGH